MKKISLCMIVKNEEKVLARCLKSIKEVVDEIIIVDTGSTDKTKEIAKKFTDKVYDFTWCDNFSLARNYSFSKASYEYIMWLDADDFVPIKTRKYLLTLKEKMQADTYMLKYQLGTDKKNCLVFYRERILKKSPQCVWQGYVHECIAPYGKIEYLDIGIEHKKECINNPTRNLDIYNKLIKQRTLNTRELYYYARELHDNKKYKKSINAFQEFLKRKDSWIENKIDAYYMLGLNYYLLKDYTNSLKYLFLSLTITTPRANSSCLIGDIFLSQYEYKLAIYWYKLAIKNNLSKHGEFVNSQFFGYYPHIQLVVCYYFLGNIQQAMYHNKQAEKYNPSSLSVQFNNNFFNNIKNIKRTTF